MPFGLCNAPEAFQIFIDEVLRDFLDICAVAYIDDILIYSMTPQEHVKHVRAILEQLKEIGYMPNWKSVNSIKPQSLSWAILYLRKVWKWIHRKCRLFYNGNPQLL